VLSVALRLKETLDTLCGMERYRGHLYNWYDTANLQPLAPRYVSAVDSGNLAGCLLAVKHSCVELTTSPLVGATRWEGMLDTAGVLDEVVAVASHRYGSSRFAALRGCVDRVRGQVAVLKDHPEDWARGVTRLVEEGCPEFDRALASVIAPQLEELDARLLSELRAWYSQTHQHLEGMLRGLDDDLVIAPYACALAVRVAPHAVLENLDRLQQLGMMGRYGLYEAIDSTPSRQRPDRAPAIVRSFMAHHQGMIFVALDNLLNGDPMVRRFHSEPVAQTAEVLLFERPVTRVPIEQTRPEPAHRRVPVRPHPAMQPWPVPPHPGSRGFSAAPDAAAGASLLAPARCPHRPGDPE
jgi:hypothetical protein